MLVKIVIVFLGAMAIVGMIGKVLFPGAMRRLTQRKSVAKSPVCGKCGRYVLGNTKCDCGKG